MYNSSRMNLAALNVNLKVNEKDHIDSLLEYCFQDISKCLALLATNLKEEIMMERQQKEHEIDQLKKKFETLHHSLNDQCKKVYVPQQYKEVQLDKLSIQDFQSIDKSSVTKLKRSRIKIEQDKAMLVTSAVRNSYQENFKDKNKISLLRPNSPLKLIDHKSKTPESYNALSSEHSHLELDVNSIILNNENTLTKSYEKELNAVKKDNSFSCYNLSPKRYKQQKLTTVVFPQNSPLTLEKGNFDDLEETKLKTQQLPLFMNAPPTNTLSEDILLYLEHNTVVNNSTTIDPLSLDQTNLETQQKPLLTNGQSTKKSSKDVVQQSSVRPQKLQRTTVVNSCIKNKFRIENEKNHVKKQELLHFMPNSFEVPPDELAAFISNKVDEHHHNHRFTHVVRKKMDRKNLPANSCAECSAYYKDLSPNRMAQCMARCSRHRAQYQKPSTPPGYWDVDFPSSPAINND